MSILITGGAGFIGSHSAKLLSESGMEIVLLDNLSTGRRENARWGVFVEGDISDVTLMRRVFRQHGVTAVLHLAASAQVGDSMLRPDAYFSNNVAGSLAVLEAMVAEGLRQIVFASSCSVYGNPASEKVREDEAVSPLSPYGESKLFIERALSWYERAFGLHWIALRYFNAAGAEDGLGEGERSLRVIPRAIHAALRGSGPLRVYGVAFPTCDGTAVRDYVHVNDIAHANLLALRYVANGHPGAVVNIGAGVGTSVRQIIDAVGIHAGRAVPFIENPPRVGDPAIVIAHNSTSSELLGWTPTRSDLGSIITSAVASCRHDAEPKAARARALARG